MNRFENNQKEWTNVTNERMQTDINSRLEARKRRKNRTIALYIIACSSAIIVVLVALAVGLHMFSRQTAGSGAGTPQEGTGATGTQDTEGMGDVVDKPTGVLKPEWDEQFLTPNEYSRPQDALEEVTGIVVHYVGNPNTTAKQNRDYFEDLAITQDNSASSHFVIGLEGEIIQCIPLNEIAYATRHRNVDTISIEVCHPDETGKFNQVTYDALIELTAWLVDEYELTTEEVIRHYDVTGKECPKYFVDNESAWEDFKLDLQKYIDKNSEK